MWYQSCTKVLTMFGSKYFKVRKQLVLLLLKARFSYLSQIKFVKQSLFFTFIKPSYTTYVVLSISMKIQN